MSFRVFFFIHALWLILLGLLAGWWGYLIFHQGELIAGLQAQVGISQDFIEASTIKKHRMVLWESSAFFLVIFGSVVLAYWLYYQDYLRNKGVQAFFASFTHELKTPLTSIRLQGEAIADRFGSVPEAEPYVRRLLQDTMRLELQVERSLELARLEGGAKIPVKSFPIKPLIERTLKFWKDSHLTSHDGVVQVSLELCEENILADLGTVQIVIKNLLENSLKHSHQDNLKIHIQAIPQATYVRVTLKDNGKGNGDIDSKKLGHIFQRGTSSTGAGVGLYLVQKLMRLMQGYSEFAFNDGFSANLYFKKAEEDRG